MLATWKAWNELSGHWQEKGANALSTGMPTAFARPGGNKFANTSAKTKICMQYEAMKRGGEACVLSVCHAMMNHGA